MLRMDQDQDDPAKNEQIETAVFGKQVEMFWDGQIGQYLLAYTLQEYNDALEEFKKCDPHDSVKIANVQNRMWRAESFRDWLSRAIDAGIQATQVLEGHFDETQ